MNSNLSIANLIPKWTNRVWFDGDKIKSVVHTHIQLNHLFAAHWLQSHSFCTFFFLLSFYKYQRHSEVIFCRQFDSSVYAISPKIDGCYFFFCAKIAIFKQQTIQWMNRFKIQFQFKFVLFAQWNNSLKIVFHNSS